MRKYSWGGITAPGLATPITPSFGAGSYDVASLEQDKGCAQGSRAWNEVMTTAGAAMQLWPATIANPSHEA